MHKPKRNIPILEEDSECCKLLFIVISEHWFLIKHSEEASEISLSPSKVDNSSVSITKVLSQVGHFNCLVPNKRYWSFVKMRRVTKHSEFCIAVKNIPDTEELITLRYSES